MQCEAATSHLALWYAFKGSTAGGYSHQFTPGKKNLERCYHPFIFWNLTHALEFEFHLQIIVLAAFFQQSINQAGLQVMGLFLAIIGLTLFLDGLRVAIMVSYRLFESKHKFKFS